MLGTVFTLQLGVMKFYVTYTKQIPLGGPDSPVFGTPPLQIFRMTEGLLYLNFRSASQWNKESNPGSRIASFVTRQVKFFQCVADNSGRQFQRFREKNAVPSTVKIKAAGSPQNIATQLAETRCLISEHNCLLFHLHRSLKNSNYEVKITHRKKLKFE